MQCYIVKDTLLHTAFSAISHRCELTRGGKSTSKAKYTFRRFIFEDNKWSGHIYHYSDSWCTKPTFTIRFKGSFKVYPANSTQSVVVSSASDFKFTDIKFKSGNRESVENFFKFMMTKCPDALPNYSSTQSDNRLDPSTLVNKDIDIDDYVLKKKHCRYFLALHPYSYRKFRVVRDKVQRKHSTLFFGDIPKFTERNVHLFKPQSFQYGLARVDAPDCTICKLAVDGDKAPVLPAPTQKNNYKGEWVLEKCTAVDENNYFTISYGIGSNGRFTLYNAIFLDGDCKKKKYAYEIGGPYSTFSLDGNIDGLVGLRLTYSRMKLTVYHKQTLNFLRNSNNCGIREFWKEGVEQDVTSTHGCQELFPVRLPIVSSMLVRAATIGGKRELYIEDYEKGLSFMYNLVTCDSVTRGIVPKKSTVRPTISNEVTLSTERNLNKVVVDEQIEKMLKNELEKQNGRSAGVLLKPNRVLTSLLLFCVSLLVVMKIL